MGSLSTFGTFTMARLGIFVSQQALNVTGNNIANINTDGYTRQELDQSAMHFGTADKYISQMVVRENGGVLATGVNQLRDKYLDIRYRNEATKVGEMETKLDGLNQLADIFDEVTRADGDGVLEARFNDLIQQIENLHQPQNVGKDDMDALAREAAEALAVQFNDYSKQLDTLESNLNAQFHDQVDSVNTMLTKIRDLNTSIRKSDIFGSNSLVQRDERNLLIDQLSEKIGINVTVEMENLGDGTEVEKMVIKTSGQPERTLVDGVYATQLSVAQVTEAVARTDAAGNPLMENGKPVTDWVTKESENFDIVLSPLEDEKGRLDPIQSASLKNIQTVQSYGERASDWDAVKDQVNRLYFASAEDAKAYEDKINQQFGFAYGTQPYFSVSNTETSQSEGENVYVVQYHADGNYNFVNIDDTKGVTLGDTELSGGLQAMREMLTEEGEYADVNDLQRDPEAGVKRGIRYYRQALDTLARTFAEAMNEANTIPDDQLYTTDSSGSAVIKPEYSYYNGGALFTNNSNSSGTTDDITAANISVSYGWSHGATRMLRSKEENAPSNAQENLGHFISMMTAEHDFTFGTATEGTTKFTGTFQEMLTNTISGTLAKDQSITESMLDNYNATADELYINRDSVMGVDLNDEAMNMMMFQKAYSAACRLMTTFDGLLDKLINGTAL